MLNSVFSSAAFSISAVSLLRKPVFDPQQYQLLQCVYGMPDALEPTIANVAARMLLKHNSAVELVDRTIEQGLLRRAPDPTDTVASCYVLRPMVNALWVHSRPLTLKSLTRLAPN